MKNLLLFTALFLFQIMTAQTYELNNSINFNDVNDGRDVPDGITWFKPAPMNYGIYRTSGQWLSPNYQQLKIAFDTGIIIEGGSSYGKSGTIIQPNGGNVGIGTSSPLAKFDIVTASGSGSGGAEGIRINDGQGLPMSINLGVNTNNLYSWIQSSQGGVGPKNLILNPSSGNVGIGITNPNNKLDVNGTIHSKEVKVDMIGWSDFVFKKEYSLPTLEEVEKQINEKGHLANIPSEDEVIKNGINLGEMNAKLLAKVEELTLYLIEQEKKNARQNLEIEELKKENKTFKNILDRLSKIEEKLK